MCGFLFLFLHDFRKVSDRKNETGFSPMKPTQHMHLHETFFLFTDTFSHCSTHMHTWPQAHMRQCSTSLRDHHMRQDTQTVVGAATVAHA